MARWAGLANEYSGIARSAGMVTRAAACSPSRAVTRSTARHTAGPLATAATRGPGKLTGSWPHSGRDGWRRSGPDSETSRPDAARRDRVTRSAGRHGHGQRAVFRARPVHLDQQLGPGAGSDGYPDQPAIRGPPRRPGAGHHEMAAGQDLAAGRPGAPGQPDRHRVRRGGQCPGHPGRPGQCGRRVLADPGHHQPDENQHHRGHSEQEAARIRIPAPVIARDIPAHGNPESHILPEKRPCRAGLPGAHETAHPGTSCRGAGRAGSPALPGAGHAWARPPDGQ